MDKTTSQLLSLPALAEALKLPKKWLRAEANAGRLPHLRIGSRYRFNRAAVEAAILRRASKSDDGGVQ